LTTIDALDEDIVLGANVAGRRTGR